MKCSYCDKEATYTRTVDIDVKGIPLCDNEDCFYKMYIDIMEWLQKFNK